MNDYLTTDTEISELLETGDDYMSLLEKHTNLTNEVDTLRKQKKDKEFESENRISILNIENENLKSSIKSYEELINFYKRKNLDINIENITNNNLSNAQSEFAKSNMNYIAKISDLENKIFILEQNEHNFKREIYSLNSRLNEAKSDLEGKNNTTDQMCIINSNNLDCGEKDSDWNIDENDIQELLSEIDDLKKEKAEVSEKALNILAEKELLIFDLITQIEEMKTKYENTSNKLTDKIITFHSQNSNNSNDYFTTNNSESITIDNLPHEELVFKYNNLNTYVESLKSSLEESETLLQIERTNTNELNYYVESLTTANRNFSSEFENEIAKLKNEIQNLQLERSSLNKQLVNDHTSIQEEMENYSHTIKSLEDQKGISENNLNNHIEMLTGEIKNLEMRDSILREQNLNLEKHISEVKNENLKKIESLQEKWKYELSLKQNEIIKLKSRTEILEKEKDKLKKECDANKRNNENMKIEYSDLLERLDSVKMMNDDEKLNLENKIKTLEKSHESERTFLNTQIKEFKSVIEERGINYNENKPTKSNKEKDNTINLMDYNSEENPVLLKTKLKNLQSEVKRLNSLIKLKENKSANVFRLNGEIEILKKEKTKLRKEMTEMKEMYDIQIKDLLSKLDLTERKSNFRPGFNSQDIVKELELELEDRIERLIKENKFLKDNLEITKREVENIKVLKDNHINKLKEDVEEAETITATAKVCLAQAMFEKDSEVIRYKTICKKLKIRLNGYKANNFNENNPSSNLGVYTNPQIATPKKKTSIFHNLFK